MHVSCCREVREPHQTAGLQAQPAWTRTATDTSSTPSTLLQPTPLTGCLRPQTRRKRGPIGPVHSKQDPEKMAIGHTPQRVSGVGATGFEPVTSAV
jgi:hypothetical protein